LTTAARMINTAIMLLIVNVKPRAIGGIGMLMIAVEGD